MSLAKRIVTKTCVLFTALVAIAGATAFICRENITNSEAGRTAMIKSMFKSNNARESQLRHLKSRQEELSKQLRVLTNAAPTSESQAAVKQVFSEMQNVSLDIEIIQNLLDKSC